MSKSSNSNQKEDNFSYSSLNTNDTINKEKEKKKIGKFDPESSRYPICLVWTPLPLITALIPCIGHVGICNSEGIIHDFSGPYYISVDDMAFGQPTKYVKLDISENEIKEWDKSIMKGMGNYQKMNYSFFCNNCHSYCAHVLNVMKYKGKSNYNMVNIWWMVSTKSKYVSWGRLFKTYFPTIIIFLIIYFIHYLSKLSN